MNKNKRIILLCERGWRGIREFSLFLEHNNLDVFVLIKGLPKRQVRKMITSYSRIHNIFLPARIYSIFLFIYLLCNLAIYKIYLFISTSNRSKKGAVSFFRIQPCFVSERPSSYSIQDSEGKKIRPEIILEKIYS